MVFSGEYQPTFAHYNSISNVRMKMCRETEEHWESLISICQSSHADLGHILPINGCFIISFITHQHKLSFTAGRPLDAQRRPSCSTDRLPHTLTCRRASTVNTLHTFTPETSPWLHARVHRHTRTHELKWLSEKILCWSQLEVRHLHLCSSSIVIKQAAVQTAQKI